MRRAPGLRREELAVAVLLRALEVAPLGARAGRREDGLEEEHARHVHRADVTAIDPTDIPHHLAVERRRIGVHVPPLDPEPALEALDRHRLGLEGVLLGAAERLRVDEREMREVAQVVDDQQIVRLVVQIAGQAPPSRLAQIREVEDEGGIGLGRIPDPDPHEVIALEDRVAPHTELGGHHVLPGDLHALTGRVVLQAVIHAPHGVALEPAVRELRAAVRAAVVERHDFPALAVVGQDRLLEDHAREELPVDQLVVPGRDVPAVHQETVGLGRHRALPSGYARLRSSLSPTDSIARSGAGAARSSASSRAVRSIVSRLRASHPATSEPGSFPGPFASTLPASVRWSPAISSRIEPLASVCQWLSEGSFPMRSRSHARPSFAESWKYTPATTSTGRFAASAISMMSSAANIVSREATSSAISCGTPAWVQRTAWTSSCERACASRSSSRWL